MRRILRRLLPGVLAVLCLLGLGAALHRGAVLQHRRALLEELEQNRGSYDSRSIVLQDTGLARAQRLARRYGAELRITGDGSYARLTLPEDRDIEAVIAGCMSLGALNDMSPDYRSYTAEPVADGPADPECPRQTYLETMNMENVWELTRGSGILVAVIDTGIDTDHPEFAGRISQRSYNATEDKTVREHGLSVIEDEQGHGTSVCGVIAAAMDGVGTAGMAPEAELLVIKVQCDSAGNFLRTSDLVFGLYYAIEQGARVVNMSFSGTETDNPYQKAARLAWERDIVCVAASGNKGTAEAQWPGADAHVICVGAVDGQGALAGYANYGETLELVAPGTAYTTARGGGYRSVSGTSFSCPMVSAAAALLLSREEASAGQVRTLLHASCRDLGTPGRDFEYGFGIPDVSALVQGQRGTVTFDMGTDEVEDEKKTFLRGISIQELPEPERPDGVFAGWYYDPGFTREYRYYEDIFHEDLTLYARWANEDNGIPYTYATLDDGTVEIRSYTGRRRFITVPEKIDGKAVSSIGDFAFEDQTRLQQVDLPEGLTKIGRGAFRGCTNLTQIRIPSGVTTLPEETFRDAARLRTVLFAAGSELKTLEGYVFAGCASLDKVELPASVTKVSGTDFLGAVSMTRITVASGSGKFSHKDGVLFNAAGDTVVVYPAGKGSHYDLPEGTVRVDDYAFAYAQLDTVDLTGLEKINEGAFRYSALQTVTVPDSVNRVEEYAFSDCPELETVRLGSGITVISQGMFRQCTALESVTVPERIRKIAAGAFAEAGLREVIFPEGSGLKTLEEGAFRNCRLEELSLPATVETVGDEAFAGNRSLTGVNLPQGLKTLGEKAFWDCGITTAAVPAAVEQIGAGAFGLCPGLENVSVSGDNGVYQSVDGVLLTKDGGLLHTFPGGKRADTYTVPETVRALERFSFAGTGKLETLVLPEGLAVLEREALRYGGFRALVLPQTLTRIGDGALADTAGLERITIPDGVELLGREAFAGSAVTSVVFGAGSRLTRLGTRAFYGCRSLAELILPDAPVEIGWCAVPWLHEHRYTDTVTEPDCVNGGFTVHTCACGDSFTDSEVPALGHDMQNGVCSRCGAEEPQGTPGDANGDGRADYSDALLILRASIGLGEMDEALVMRCDMNGDGRMDYTDALTVLRRSIGLE